MESAQTSQTPAPETNQPEQTYSLDSKHLVNIKLIFSVLNIIKTSQNHHGLRHGDYQRYRYWYSTPYSLRLYCSRRLRRIRRSLKFTHGKVKFTKKTVDASVVTNMRFSSPFGCVNVFRFLLLVLVSAERCWSYSMQLKDELADNARARVQMHKKLKKAAQYATKLEELCNAKADKRTILEAEVRGGECYHNEPLNRHTVRGWMGIISWRKNSGRRLLPSLLNRGNLIGGSLTLRERFILNSERLEMLSFKICASKKWRRLNRASDIAITIWAQRIPQIWSLSTWTKHLD